MFRHLAAVVLGVSALGAASAADAPKKVTIRWYGQSFFQIVSSKGTRIVTDPHNIEALGYPPGIKADLITMSHNHNDHTMISSVENGDKAKVLPGWKGEDKKADWNPIDEKFRDVHIKTVGVYHDDQHGKDRGKNSVFIFEVDGLRIVHLGDLGHLLNKTQIKQIGTPDVLMIPVGGVFTINGEEAKKVVAQLKPRRYIIPMHYGIGSFDDVLTADEFLDEQKKENIKRSKGNELVVRTDFAPAEPIIAMLNYRSEAAERAAQDK
jgi:L-ascorbate metabolism protein UlaG (beta-lactamase superfamily)